LFNYILQKLNENFISDKKISIGKLSHLKKFLIDILFEAKSNGKTNSRVKQEEYFHWNVRKTFRTESLS